MICKSIGLTVDDNGVTVLGALKIIDEILKSPVEQELKDKDILAFNSIISKINNNLKIDVKEFYDEESQKHLMISFPEETKNEFIDKWLIKNKLPQKSIKTPDMSYYMIKVEKQKNIIELIYCKDI